MSTSIDMVSILTIILVLVDDWYNSQGKRLLKGKVGATSIWQYYLASVTNAQFWQDWAQRG